MMDSSIIRKYNPAQMDWAMRVYGDRKSWRFYRDDPNDWPDLSAPLDSDKDGMPDVWEDSEGLDKNTADHNGTNLSIDGYTNIEVYINQRADDLVGAPPVSTKPANYSSLRILNGIDCFPNPFSGQVSFVHRSSYVVHRDLNMRIYSIDGALIRQISSRRTMHDERPMMQWDGRDNHGNPVNAGTYIIKIWDGNRVYNKQIMCLK
ncbi:MAG: T9SS type A sorting domain-containing protein [bacterium]